MPNKEDSSLGSFQDSILDFLHRFSPSLDDHQLWIVKRNNLVVSVRIILFVVFLKDIFQSADICWRCKKDGEILIILFLLNFLCDCGRLFLFVNPQVFLFLFNCCLVDGEVVCIGNRLEILPVKESAVIIILYWTTQHDGNKDFPPIDLLKPVKLIEEVGHIIDVCLNMTLNPLHVVGKLILICPTFCLLLSTQSTCYCFGVVRI